MPKINFLGINIRKSWGKEIYLVQTFTKVIFQNFLVYKLLRATVIYSCHCNYQLDYISRGLRYHNMKYLKKVTRINFREGELSQMALKITISWIPAKLFTNKVICYEVTLSLAKQEPLALLLFQFSLHLILYNLELIIFSRKPPCAFLDLLVYYLYVK